ncbi:peptide ABC transporter substrate-binding protein [Microlunatus endophyticus]|uniref:Peptide ABC transporter substrate-binding protein n=1 Tax=Microlunatus endophyticus TaxID=1716077 RepID=A0A917W2U4_9ACTN|nr:ABC transporter family substrate-binding protein [Microlunatus endophyticus]GGL56841.1 peptide ABC transporter substrate-binding protein [Microlunatus endophyticus]
MRVRRSALVAAVAAMTLTAAACGGGGSGPGDQGQTGQPKAGSTASAGLPTTDYTKLAYGQVKQGGTLTLAIGQLPTNWNNNAADGNLADTQTLQGPLIGSGIKIAADGSWQLNPDYATSIKVTNDSPTTVDVQINPKAIWDDGKPITAADMISYWKAQNGTNKKFSPAGTACFEDIKDVKQVGSDTRHYTVTFDGAYAEWPACVWPDLPQEVTKSPEAYNTGFKSKQWTGDGPYVIDSVDQNGGVITEVPNPKWWGRKPKLDKIIFRVIDQSGLGQSFANNEVSSINTGAQLDVLKQAEARSGAVVQRSGGTTYTQLTLNAESGPLTDLNVRKAIFYAINRQQFAAVTQKGLGVPAVTVGSSILLPGQAGYANTQDAMYPHDVAKAQAALKAAGYTITDGKAMKGGQQLTLSIVTPAETPTNNQRAQLVQNYLQQAGMKVTIKNVPSDKYFSDYVVTGPDKNFEMTSFSYVGSAFPIGGAKGIFTPADSGANFSGISSPQIGDLFKQAGSTVDPTQRYAVIKKLDNAIYSLAVMVTFTATPNIVVSDPNLVNYGAVQFETTDWTQVGFKS